MALFVNTNVSSINGQRNLTNATNNLNTTYQRLSSGLRINSAKDDAAGLQISDRLTSQINGLNQGNRNTNDGIALAQTVEGAMDEMTTMLQRIRTLAVQSSNGTNNQKDRDALQQEVTQLSTEITRIACQTRFGGEVVLAGASGQAGVMKGLIATDGSIQLQVGAYNGDTLKMTGFSSGFVVSSIAKEAGLTPAAATKDGLIMTAAGAARFAISTQTDSMDAIASVDKMIEVIDKQRAHLGAMQNRMESTIRNQSNISMNVSDARSRIRDTDFAEESAKLSQQTIIQQAASSMLTQANTRPQLALSLLG
ncbi:flagellin N-terminal helical domain-containing protein [Anaerobiospirillum thomasii]|uniref:Flagellin n=1 Tax=Anaerobiospirillum thomasii TaxID=179995 RepID=A0A2X0V659_9GAMM|nr:flagellin [Anaerobiospirillum thomasii]SPT69939.1 A-type flagellin [Anaerobiospirillum thomasii]